MEIKLPKIPEKAFENTKTRLQDYVLKDVSFQINNRQKVAIVGENGSGKTTLVKLLMRFHQNQVDIQNDICNLCGSFKICFPHYQVQKQ